MDARRKGTSKDLGEDTGGLLRRGKWTRFVMISAMVGIYTGVDSGSGGLGFQAHKYYY